LSLTFAAVCPTTVAAYARTSLEISKPLKEYQMKKILFLGAVLALAGCAGEKKAEAPASSEAPAAGAPATPPADTGMGTMQHDSTMARDTSKKM
jgi:hypothetical protein